MTPERIQEILEKTQSPSLKIALKTNATTMGGAYVLETTAKIVEAKEVLNQMAEEIEKELTKLEIDELKLEEQLQLRTEIHITTLTPAETAGMDAKAREALAKRKAEAEYKAEMEALALQTGAPPPTLTLRQEILDTKVQLKELKMVFKMVTNRIAELGKTDSALRLQFNAIQADLSLLGVRPKPQDSFSLRSGYPRRKDDSVKEGIRDHMVGHDEFDSLIQTDPTLPGKGEETGSATSFLRVEEAVTDPPVKTTEKSIGSDPPLPS